MASRSKKRLLRDPKRHRQHLFERIRTKDVDVVLVFEKIDIVTRCSCDCGYLSKIGELCGSCAVKNYHFLICNNCATKRGINLQEMLISQQIENKGW